MEFHSRPNLNCFKKLGISLEAVEKHIIDNNDPFCGLDRGDCN